MKVTVGAPDDNLGRVDGTVKINDTETKIEVNNLLPKGALIEHSKTILALVIYTGLDTKIKLAKTSPRTKMGRFEKFFLKIFGIYIVVISALGLTNLLMIQKNEKAMKSTATYIFFNPDNNLIGISQVVNCFIRYQQLIPIILLVMLSIQRYAYMGVFYNDLEMFGSSINTIDIIDDIA
jgi:hypothetical protein